MITGMSFILFFKLLHKQVKLRSEGSLQAKITNYHPGEKKLGANIREKSDCIATIWALASILVQK